MGRTFPPLSRPQRKLTLAGALARFLLRAPSPVSRSLYPRLWGFVLFTSAGDAMIAAGAGSAETCERTLSKERITPKSRWRQSHVRVLIRPSVSSSVVTPVYRSSSPVAPAPPPPSPPGTVISRLIGLRYETLAYIEPSL